MTPCELWITTTVLWACATLDAVQQQRRSLRRGAVQKRTAS